MAGDDLPLESVRVVDFTRLLPGPWCTQVLGDFGADVIKIEQPEIGDYGRFNPPHYKETGVYFASVNRNKRSIAVDLSVADDLSIAHQLVETADIVVESFRPGVTAKYGIDYESVRKRNPAVIYASINGFGSFGSASTLPGHDLSIQGMAGLIRPTEQGTAPSIPLFQAGDYAGATYAAIGILGAYVRRLKTGRGCYLDVPMYDTLLSMSSVTLSSALARAAGFSGEPSIGSFGTNPRFAVYLTKDKKLVTVSLLEARTWAHFCNHIGRPDLIYEESLSDRHSTHGGFEDTFRRVITEFCLSETRDVLVERMRSKGIPICAVYTDDETVSSPVAKSRDVLAFAPHPREGAIPYFRDPLERAGLSDPTRRHVPSLGEHSSEIRQELNVPAAAK